MFSQLTVGERLRLARKAAKFGGQELGEFIGVGKSQISNLENNHSELTRANAIKLSEILGIRLNWLLTGEGGMTEQENRSGAYNNLNNTGTNTVSIGGYGAQQENPVVQMLQEQIRDLKAELAACNEERRQLLDMVLKNK